MSQIKLESEYDDLDKYIDIHGSIYYYKQGTNIRHSLHGPALIAKNGHGIYFINDQYLSKEYFEVHPERLKYLGNLFNMPKVQSEYPDLDKYQKEFEIRYFKKDTKIYHNPYGPAYIDKDGYIAYIINGKWHRLDGPARIWLNVEERYYINGEKLSKEEFELHPERLKYLGKEYLICLG